MTQRWHFRMCVITEEQKSRNYGRIQIISDVPNAISVKNNDIKIEICCQKTAALRGKMSQDKIILVSLWRPNQKKQAKESKQTRRNEAVKNKRQTQCVSDARKCIYIYTNHCSLLPTFNLLAWISSVTNILSAAQPRSFRHLVFSLNENGRSYSNVTG